MLPNSDNILVHVKTESEPKFLGWAFSLIYKNFMGFIKLIKTKILLRIFWNRCVKAEGSY